jgi:hypothetical protein
METNENIHGQEAPATRPPERLQMMPIDQAKDWYNDFVNFSKSILKQDLDFGIIPGTPKPSLYKPGAEKLRFVYGLSSEIRCIDKTIDLDRPFIDYTYRCTIKSKTGQILAQCEGSCNSMEPKYGYVWKTLKELPEGIDISKLPSRTIGKKISEFDFKLLASMASRRNTGKNGLKPSIQVLQRRSKKEASTAESSMHGKLMKH